MDHQNNDNSKDGGSTPHINVTESDDTNKSKQNVESETWITGNDNSSADLLSNMTENNIPPVVGDSKDAVTESSVETDSNNDIYTNQGYKSSSPSRSDTTSDKCSSSDASDEICSVTQPLIQVTDTEKQQSDSRRTSVENGKRKSGSAYELCPNDITHIQIEEITPKPLTIANKLTIADEYFLHSSQNSISSCNKPTKRRANTMQDIHNEKGSFLSISSNSRVGKAMHSALLHLKDDKAFSSMVAINTSAMKELEQKHVITDDVHIPVVASTNYTRNVYMLGICCMLNFIALGSVRNLQSSINHEGGIGVISMAVSFLGYMSASTFSTVLVQSIQPHKIFVAHLVPHFLYVAANIYPAPWLLAPVSFFQGVALAIGWNAMSTYMTLLSAGEANLKNVDYSHTSGKYFGLFGLYFQAYFIVGNLIASLVLTYANSGKPSDHDSLLENVLLNSSTQSNITPFYTGFNASTTVTPDEVSYLHLCGAEYWQHYELGGAALYVSNETKYLLYGLYMACVVTAIGISIFKIEPINLHYFDRSQSTRRRLKIHIWKLMKLWVTPKFLLIVPLQMYSFMEVGFATAEITKAFVTCPIGIHMVGWTMMFLGICGSISSYVGGLLTKYIGRTSQLITACLCNVGVLIMMALWHPTQDSYVLYFVITGLWGASDGLWVAHINSLINTVFPNNYEEAFSGLRMCQGIGVAIVFGYSNHLSMLAKIYVTGVFCLFALFLYCIHTCIYRPERQNKKDIELVVEQTPV